jgi:phage-related protein
MPAGPPTPPPSRKPLYWMGSTLKDLKAMAVPVQKFFGAALRDVQYGETPDEAKPWKGLGSGVLEIVEDYDRSTYRAVYTVTFPGAVYVLHVFQKKAKHGIATPRPDVELVRSRYKFARAHYRAWQQQQEEHDG